MPNLQPPRRGWPLPDIPAGKAAWQAFVAHATYEQPEQACLSLVYALLREGTLALATEGLLDRARRGVGGVAQCSPHEHRPDRLADAIAAFLRSREAAGCTAATLKTSATDVGRVLGETVPRSLDASGAAGGEAST